MAAKSDFSKLTMDLIARQSLNEAEAQTDSTKAYNDSNVYNLPRNKQFTLEGMTTVLSKNTVVVGEIVSNEDLEIHGNIKGMVKTSGDIAATGKIVGDLTGNNFELEGASIQGNIVASGNVVIAENTIIIGDITANSIKVNGRIKGNLKISNLSEFQDKAILSGNVRSHAISMSQGAKISGNVSVASENAFGDKEFEMEIEI